ncbi:MAG TPA: universal stress protein [Vicinamibacterales bacterium]|jgi:nucleotide-binding universal stress UspA family protein
MPTTHTIVCAIDFSEHSRAALFQALAWAEHISGRLIVVTVIEPLLASAAAAAFDTDLARDEVLPELREFVRKVATERGPSHAPFDGVVLTGDPAHEIVGLAQRERASLLVIATHGLSGYRKMFLGSTTEAVLRTTEVPVLVAPPPDQIPTHRTSGLQDPVLAPVDFKSGSVKAVRAAAGVARMFRAPLLLVHVVAPLRGLDRLRAQLDTHNRAQIDRAEQQLDQLISQAGAAERVEKLVIAGSPPEQISEVAVARGVQLIVMRLRGEEGLLGSRPGSIAYHVLRLTPAMVLALPTSHAQAGWLEQL